MVAPNESVGQSMGSDSMVVEGDGVFGHRIPLHQSRIRGTDLRQNVRQRWAALTLRDASLARRACAA